MSNAELAAACQKYAAVEDSYVNALREKGLKFAEHGTGEERIAQLREELASRGAQFKNAGASIVVGWKYKACVECTGSNGS